jgi:ribosomal protein S27AE
MKKINWTCPKCGGTKMVMLTTKVVTESPILGLTEDAKNTICGEVEIADVEDSSSTRYECGTCRYLIAKDYDEAFIEAILPANGDKADDNH